MLFAHIGPYFGEALLLLTALFGAVVLAALAWLIGVVGAALFEALGAAWLLARLLPRSFKRAWFWRPWLLSIVFGSVLGASLGATLVSFPDEGLPPLWPILLGIPFMLVCAVLAVVEVVRALRWAKQQRAATASQAAGDAARTAGRATLRRLGARALVLLGQALNSALVGLLALVLVLGSGSDLKFNAWVESAVIIVFPALLAILPWYWARRGGKLVPPLEDGAPAEAP